MTRREREVTDINEILKIMDACKIVHIGLVDGDQPYVLPMNYGYTYEAGKMVIYLHGAKKGYKYDLIEKNRRYALKWSVMWCHLKERWHASMVIPIPVLWEKGKLLS